MAGLVVVAVNRMPAAEVEVSADLVRRLRERGAEVQVVMTAAAREFVTPATFQALSGRTVRSDLWDPAAEAAEFTRLSRLSHGNSRGWKFNREEIHERK